MSDLAALSRHHGLTTEYDDPAGGTRPVPDATLRLILEKIGVDPDAAPGGEAAATRMEVPDGGVCHLPGWLENAPAWGLFCQLYELRSARNHGIGDFADLAQMARIAGRAGADFLGVNPLHALFLADPGLRSPFSPSSRSFLNPVYIALDLLPGHDPADIDGAALRAGDLVDYDAVVPAKLEALRVAHRRQAFDGDEAAFEAFVERGGAPLRRHALFEALSLAMAAEGHGAGWRGWPEAMRDVESPEVGAFAEDHADEIRFHLWLQWRAATQLDAAMAAAREAGMRIGLYLDLAVGEAPDGSASWGGGEVQMTGLSVGAPPDVFAAEGQNWGLSAFNPGALATRDFAPFRDMIDAQLAHAGALRIDHAMALWQLFLIPEGESAAAGAHLRYPFAELLRVLAAESHAREAVVIGEDLGFVPPGFREAMRAANILSYSILYFEKDGDRFLPPDAYRRRALACLSTHDLPVLSRWWAGEDIALRRELGLVGPEDSAAHAKGRARERRALLDALRRAGALRGRLPREREMPREVLVAAYRFLARTPCLLAGVRLADLVGPAAPTNMPGTVDSYPNWQPRAPLDLDEIAAHPDFRAVTATMRRERPRG
ncbi:4-alpha-glucanotransferase [Limimaricola pyoseonensis]|uniref:4-alpha-glucanotransferase n=1 Tax=Limimaricola pyoseonensis TaxID=521013 RepID=A0A1G7KFL4_9RHOB|nr:4-alpha-glucanotransferase [Limimaricola pyoseonensis]SDF35629.1 4-alpha-glucanotransferase [Limimaricola pyoseonensis]